MHKSFWVVNMSETSFIPYGKHMTFRCRKCPHLLSVPIVDEFRQGIYCDKCGAYNAVVLWIKDGELVLKIYDNF